MSRTNSAAPSRRNSFRPHEDKDANRYEDDSVSPKSSRPSSRHFETLINIPSDVVHHFSGPDESLHDHDAYTSRRRSSLFSLQLPVSRRRMVRLSLLCSLATLFILTLSSGARNRRRSRLITAAGATSYTNLGGLKWPTWVDAELGSRLNSRGAESQSGPVRKGPLGGKLRRGLQDLGLMPVFMDGQSDLPAPPAFTPQRRLNPITTPPSQVEAREVAEEVRRAETEEEGDAMPWFWGNTDEVGASPFDHWPELDLEAGEKGKRVLFLTGESRPTSKGHSIQQQLRCFALNVKPRLQGLSGAHEHAYLRDCRFRFPPPSHRPRGCVGSRMERLASGPRHWGERSEKDVEGL